MAAGLRLRGAGCNYFSPALRACCFRFCFAFPPIGGESCKSQKLAYAGPVKAAAKAAKATKAAGHGSQT
jgi:hypothetical protein